MIISNVLSSIDDRCLIIKTRQSHVDNVGLYEATRRAWALNGNRLGKLEYALATVNGIILEVYTDLVWSMVETGILQGRFEFEGVVADEEMRNKYVGKRIPDEYRKRGMASPTLYTFSASQNTEARMRSGKMTVKAALIELSNTYKGKVRTRKEIVDELSAKYKHNEYSIHPADYEVGLDNRNPKLFRRIDHGTYECLGGDGGQSVSLSSFSCISDISQEEKFKIVPIIADRFKNGLRVSSNIDFDRFKKFYFEQYGEGFGHDDNWFNQFISSEALIYDERAYFFSDDVVNAVRLHMEELESPCIFIDFFYNKFADEFYNMNIFSVNKLRTFIEKNYPGISIKWDYIIMHDGVSPSDLIKEVFNERETWTFEELCERLPCLKAGTIRQAMNRAEYFRLAKGTYTHIGSLDLPSSEGEKLVALVESRLQKREYVTASELDLSVFEKRNHHCPFNTVRDAVFYKFFSNSYNKSGQVITKKGEKLRALDVLEHYCREAETVSFEEISNLEVELDPKGRGHSLCLVAGHNAMVRVSEELFVAKSYVDFDIQKTDDAIASYCHGNFMPLRGIADFSLFPYAGYPWNLFLLESYVRKFSRAFKYDVRAVNSSNIGAIVCKSFQYNGYDDILAHALADSLVNLSDKTVVGNCLFENGYIGWRNLGKKENFILDMAKKIREEG